MDIKLSSVESNPARLTRQVSTPKSIVKESFEFRNESIGHMLIVEAVIRGKLEVIEEAIKQNVDLKQIQNVSGVPLLHIACEHGQKDVALLLINDGGCDINQANSKGLVPLMIASRLGNCDVVKMLLMANAATNAVDEKLGFTSLHFACNSSSVATVKELLCKDPLLIKKKSYSGATSLHIAALSGNLSICQFLLEFGADVNELMSDGFSALMISCQIKNPLLASLFLDFNAELKFLDPSNGFNCLHICCKSGAVDVMMELLAVNPDLIYTKTQIGASAIHIASVTNNIEAARLLLELGADPNVQSNDGETSLMMACENGCIEMVKLLLKYNAKLNLVDVKHGCNCLHFLCKNKEANIDIFRCLLIKEKSISNSQSLKGLTSLHIASAANNLEACKILLEFDASPDITSSEGETALSMAINRGHDEIARLLLHYKASVEFLNPLNGWSSFHVACSKANVELIKDIVKSKPVMLDTCTMSGDCGLHIAAASNLLIVVQTLAELGANINIQNKIGKSALMIAIELRHIDIVNYLLNKTSIVLNLTENVNNWNCLTFACSSGMLPVAMELVHRDASLLDSRAFHDISLLHVAISANQEEICSFLLEKCANVDFPRSDNGWTPLISAVHSGNEVLVKMLLKYNAKTRINDKDKKDAYFYAVQYKRDGIIRILKPYFESNQKGRTSSSGCLIS